MPLLVSPDPGVERTHVPTCLGVEDDADPGRQDLLGAGRSSPWLPEAAAPGGGSLSPPPTHTLQFPDVVEFSETMANAGKTVIVAALDGTFQRKVRLWVGAGREEGARAAQGPFSVSVRRMRAPWTTRPCRSPDNQKNPIQEQAPQMVALCGRANLGGGRSSSWLQGL